MPTGPRRLLTYEELANYGVTYVRSHLDLLERQGKFPKRIAIGANAVRWIEAEVIDYLEAKIAQRAPQKGVLGSYPTIKKTTRKSPPAPDNDVA